MDLLWQASHVARGQEGLLEGVGAEGPLGALSSLEPSERERRAAVGEGCPEMRRREQALAARGLRSVGP